MFHNLSRTPSLTTPTLHFLRNQCQAWVYVKLMSTTCSKSKSKGNSFTVSYLINTCGFSPDRAASVAKRVNFETSEKPDLAFEFFKSSGFSQSQALSVIRGFPQLLVADPLKSLKPKIDFFKSIGFSDSDIRSIVVRYPRILARGLQSEMIPCFDFFNTMFPSEQRLMKTVKSYPFILCGLHNVSARNIKLLRVERVPESHIVRFIECFPRTLKASPKMFEEIVREIKELGFNPLRMNFVAAISVKIRRGRSTWSRKEAIYRKWGWTDYDIRAAFRVQPLCMAISNGKIEAIMDFIVNKLGYTSSAIVKCPVVLKMSLEKRIITRGSVILVLLSRGLVDGLSLSAIFLCNEEVFLDKFVYCHEKEGDELLKLYQAKMALAR